jgi:predicted ATPase/class 3 adenylate cyclase
MAEPRVPTADGPPSVPPAGLSTFLITDIEGSTRLWEEHASKMGAALAQHDRLLREAIETNGGTVVKTLGDGMLAVFADPVGALTAAIGAQRALRDAPWVETGPLRARMALHSGAAEARDADYFGPALNRSARILAIGHGGQILLSAVTALLARDRCPADVELVDMGSHRLRDLDRPEQVFQVAAADLPRTFPPLRSLSTRGSNLPIALTSFIGREREIGEIDALVQRARLVTLVGTGGTGKTRLMLEVAGRIAGRFGDGAWLVELAPLRDPDAIAPEIARALGVPEVPGQPSLETVAAFLGAKEALLLLDNAEHLVEGVAGIADRLLAGAPDLRIVTTSREALAVSGEAVFTVPSLQCPSFGDPRSTTAPIAAEELQAAAATEALRLFADRAAAVHPSFEVTIGNLESVAEICRRLDGIPLAIELAAARVAAMSPEEIAARIGDRFRLLTGGRRTAVPRQQTLHALIDWSWGLLNEDDRRMLRRLSVFSGGWTARAAARIVADDEVEPEGPDLPAAQGSDDPNEVAIVDGLARLVDRSLVLVDRGATTRYRMFETIRQFARERLVEADEAATIADRHFHWFAALADAAVPGLQGPSMADWLDRLDADAENVGAALEWGLEASPEAGIRMCDALVAYWSVRSGSAGAAAQLDRAIGIAQRLAAGPPPPGNAQLALAGHFLGRAAFLWAVRGDAAKAIGFAQQGVELARLSEDRRALLSAVIGRIMVSVFSGEELDPRPMVEESLGLAQELGDSYAIGGLAGVGGGSIMRVDPELGQRWMAIADAALRATNNPLQLAMLAVGWGRRLGAEGRIAEARARFEEAETRFAEIGDVRLALIARSDLAHVLRRAGRHLEAEAIYREVVERWLALGNLGAVASVLEGLALSLASDAQLRAARLLGAAEVIREVAGATMPADELDEYRTAVAQLRAAGPAAAIDAEWSAGRALSVSEAIALAGAVDPSPAVGGGPGS